MQVTIIEVDFEGFLYYDEIVTGSEADGLNDLDIYVNTTYDLTGETSGSPVFGIPNMASLGVPNAIKLLEVKDISDPSAIKDITSKFKLVNNQKDHLYDHSFITAKAGEVVNHGTTLKS